VVKVRSNDAEQDGVECRLSIKLQKSLESFLDVSAFFLEMQITHFISKLILVNIKINSA
jgi:hypothetical protein